jgi:hypothetical protein
MANLNGETCIFQIKRACRVRELIMDYLWPQLLSGGGHPGGFVEVVWMTDILPHDMSLKDLHMLRVSTSPIDEVQLIYVVTELRFKRGHCGYCRKQDLFPQTVMDAFKQAAFAHCMSRGCVIAPRNMPMFDAKAASCYLCLSVKIYCLECGATPYGWRRSVSKRRKWYCRDCYPGPRRYLPWP